MARKTFTVLENNPVVINHLAHTLGLSRSLSFQDIYSLTDPDLLSLIPRPVHALLVIIPLTPTWQAERESEDSQKGDYQGSGPSEPVIWFKQTINHACGSIGLLHCVLNGEAKKYITPDSTLDQIREASIPFCMADRAKVLEDSVEFEKVHEEAAKLGDSRPLVLRDEEHVGQHFVAFVKGDDGHLWELEGSRKGPVDRGFLGEGEDMLSRKAVERGIGRLIEMEKDRGGDLRFSAIALAGG
ncbi:cysteine proteinase [Delitschia confertaspora ATCC 74209]|uniref:Ubiquitin carboxyl-terminal hydrolase n=1 Tax=Delitschia confertaspora ATCC 74209 TaxID=1513339 RepID=A0A9P4N156_9PLEO|nr:cysteine proteinase [Delitschia confertaspora ATCC 74209]